MDELTNYYDKTVSMLKKIVEEQRDNIEEASNEIMKRIREDRLIYVIGTGGHSIMLAL